MRTFDQIVIGHGLAGAAVAWRLRWQGHRVLVVDGGGRGGASRVAAGLITPVTGRQLARTWRFDDCYPFAADFYRRVEAETGARLFESRTAVRLFVDDRERLDFQARDDLGLPAAGGSEVPPVNPGWFAAPHGAVEMPQAARLDVPRFLDVSRERLAADGSFLVAEIDPARDLVLPRRGAVFPRLGVRAAYVIFCQGLAARDNPWFRDVRFTPAKGEVLTVRVPGLGEDRVVHRGVWLAPAGADLFRAGATYARDDLAPAPTPHGRDEICARLRMFLRLPFEVVGHAAGVRPVVEGGKPVLGVHPEHPRLAYLNGLGSKGALFAPFFAAQLVDHLTRGRPLDPDVTRLHKKAHGAPPRVVELAHAEVRPVLGVGELAVDATAGNGRDTVFLAGLVGPSGHVFALDVHPLALHRTADRLRAGGHTNVSLVQRDHAELGHVLPAEVRRRVGAVMFNLGYLPGGDKTVATTPRSAVVAIRAGLGLLRPGGILTVVVYPGHPGGAAELNAVRGLAEEVSPMRFVFREFEPGRPNAPRLFSIRKQQ